MSLKWFTIVPSRSRLALPQVTEALERRFQEEPSGNYPVLANGKLKLELNTLRILEDGHHPPTEFYHSLTPCY